MVQSAERDFSTKKRAALDLSNFGDPSKRAFPVLNQGDLDNAARLIGHADDPAAVKRRLIAIAKRLGLSLPDSWKSEDKPKEQAVMVQTRGKHGRREWSVERTATEVSPSVSMPTFQPRQRLARVKNYFLEDDAISLNGRKYPKEATDRLIQSAQLQLSDPDSLPLTCYLSHDSADQDRTRDIVGKITQVGREGSKAYAYIDIPDTVAGRDAATLIAGGYIRSMSLRATGAEMRMDSESAFPLVGGASLTLQGIDLTTTPGLPQVARIADIVTESHEPQPLIEVFNAHPSTMLLEQGDPMETIKEEGIDPMVSGTSKGISDMGSPDDAYHARQYPVPDVQMAGEADIDQQIHDHISGAMSLECSKMTNAESTALRKTMQEAGAKFNASAKSHLLAAHDAVAKKLGVECSSNGTGKVAGGIQTGDDDGDNDANKMESTGVNDLINALRETIPQRQPAKPTPQVTPQPAKAAVVKEKKMSPEELAKLLQEAGYSVKAPPTEEEKIQEKFTAMQADFDRKLAEQLASAQASQLEAFKQALAESNAPKAAPQRRSLVEGAYEKTASRPYYTAGSYIREKMASVDFERMLDRSAPMPEGIDPERLLRELYSATWTFTPDEWNRDKNIV